ncbi:CCA tRNA nucleotidyltransferase [Prochlorococcus sp. MIT 1341]|uniref:CCA tRNA nucleotidyltransferase n=1 Tax=Prochlorococcus sp. MIT 1341 TaxID=3096221 RepID=UPI002A753B9F|nr:CCA tRNA nucleotidyltransferase [Prochlorococcus sp. MIT 1341]
MTNTKAQSHSEEDFPDMPSDIRKVFIQAAVEANIQRIALVGGAVRDWLLKDKIQLDFSNKTDLDIVVEGSAEVFVASLEKKLDASRLKNIKSSHTYDSIKLTIDETIIDISSSREETYSAPGENPIVKPCCLEKDLLRRDFSVNAIAIELCKKEILKLEGSLVDLSSKKLSFLHNKSVEEDPTRIIRAARYAARLGFTLSEDSLNQIRSTLQNWPWLWELGDNPKNAPPALSTRLKMELNLMFKNEPWQESLNQLRSWGALKLLDEKLNDLEELNDQIELGNTLGLNELTILIAKSGECLFIAERLFLPDKQCRILQESVELQELLSSKKIYNEFHSWLPSMWCKVVEERNLLPDSIALTACLMVQARSYLLDWLRYWRKVKPMISAEKLQDQGIKKGPKLGAELRSLRLKEVDRIYARK